MLLESKNSKSALVPNWQPSATINILRQRAGLMAKIRNFFAQKNILEVETPILASATVTNPYIASFAIPYLNTTYYLQTSPEYAMKRLLAAHIGPIYQITKAFRREPLSKLHNCEFTMLEWYRPGFDHWQLMGEVEELLCWILSCTKVERISYQDIFQNILQINPHTASLSDLALCVAHINYHGELTRDLCLHLLMSHVIEPQLGLQLPVIIYDFPASQAALAKIMPGDPPLAARFEVYYRGIELGNAFYELQNSVEQRQRFIQEVQERAAQGLTMVPIDEKFLAALHYGLPECSGIALGLDRLVMLALGCDSIAEVISFDCTRA